MTTHYGNETGNHGISPSKTPTGTRKGTSRKEQHQHNGTKNVSYHWKRREPIQTHGTEQLRHVKDSCGN